MRATLPLLWRPRRFPLTTKRGPHDYYKGNRTGKVGTHTARGGYRVDYSLVRTYVPPEGLADFTLTPFVTRRLPVKPGRRADGTGPPNGQSYLRAWKTDNGDD